MRDMLRNIPLFNLVSTNNDEGTHIDQIATGIRTVKTKSPYAISPTKTIEYRYEIAGKTIEPTTTVDIVIDVVPINTNDLTPISDTTVTIKTVTHNKLDSATFRDKLDVVTLHEAIATALGRNREEPPRHLDSPARFLARVGIFPRSALQSDADPPPWQTEYLFFGLEELGFHDPAEIRSDVLYDDVLEPKLEEPPDFSGLYSTFDIVSKPFHLETLAAACVH